MPWCSAIHVVHGVVTVYLSARLFHMCLYIACQYYDIGVQFLNGILCYIKSCAFLAPYIQVSLHFKTTLGTNKMWGGLILQAVLK